LGFIRLISPEGGKATYMVKDFLESLASPKTRKSYAHGFLFCRGNRTLFYNFFLTNLIWIAPTDVLRGSRRKEMKRILSSMTIILLCTSMFSIFVPHVNAQETIIFQDDFESYTVGSFPSAGGWEIIWNGAGNQYQVITSSYYASPIRSLQLMGSYGWSVVVKKDFSSSSNLIGYETRLMASEGGGGSVAFCNIPIETWGRYYAMVGFGTDGIIWACSRNNEGYQQLQPFTPYTWYKIRVLIDRSARVYNVWIDDVLNGQDIPIYYDPWEILSLQFQVGWVSIKNYFDDVKVFEVSGTPPQNGLVGYWKFDEGSGDTAADSSGNGNTGTLINGPVWVDGKQEKALSFDGVDDHVQVPQSSSLDVTDQITVETWVYPRAYVDNTGMVSHIISRCDYSGGHIYVLSTYPDSNKVLFSINPYSGEHPSVADLPLNAWTHLAMTYDGSHVRLYVNGELDSSYAQSGPIYTTSNWLAFGCKPTGPWGGSGTYAYFNGIIDEVRIYNRALSQQAIQTDMGVAPPPIQHDFTMYWSSPFYGVTAGSETIFIIHLEYSEGFDGTVTLSAQDLPDGCAAWFDIDVLKPPVSYRTLHVATPSTLSNGTYIFMVKGECGELYQVIPVTLTIGTGMVSGVVYRDENGNGIRDSGETAVPGATIAYYATQNYLNLYSASATSNSLGEFSLINVPFNVNNQITATATGLTQRCIPINIMNQVETHVDVGIKPPTILYKPVIVDGCKYQLKLLHGEGGQVTGGFILNLSDTKQPSYVDPSNPTDNNYAMGITKRVIRAMLIQELASDMININALPYQQIFGQSPQLETWLSDASSSVYWYALMPLTGFSVSLDTAVQWNDRLRGMIFDGIDSHTESWLNLNEWEETPGLDPAIAAKEYLMGVPGFESLSNNIVFWNELLEYYTTLRSYYNIFVLKKMNAEELSYLANIYWQCDTAAVSSEVKNAIEYCYSARSDYASSLLNNIGAYAVGLDWETLSQKAPSKLVEACIKEGVAAGILPHAFLALSPLLLKLKIATIILLNPQETYDYIRNAEAGRVVLKELEKIHTSYFALVNSAVEVAESQTESLAMLIEMQYRIADQTANSARSALGCSVVGKAMDIFDSSWRYTMAFFEAKQDWATGYVDFIDQRLKNDVNLIASKITVPSHAIGFVLHSPANLCVIDPQGRRIGFDAQTATTINEISTAVYTGPDCEPQVISIESPFEGRYLVLLTGTDTGLYTLDIELTTPTQTTTETCSGYIDPDEIKTHHIFIPESGDTIIVDDTPPTTKLTIGEPKYAKPPNIYVTRDTLFTLESDDDEGSGISSTAYRIFNDAYDTGWIVYSSPFNLSLLKDGTYAIAFNSTDNAGNVEPTNTIQVTLFSWTYVFTDSYGRGTTLKINIAHKFFQFITPDKDYGIRNATYMRVYNRAIIICHKDNELKLATMSIDTKLDFCIAYAKDIQTGKEYWLIDKVGTEN